MVVVIALLHPEFLYRASIANITQQAAFYGLIALGMVFVLSMGEVDLSVGGNFAFSAMTAALTSILHGRPGSVGAGLRGLSEQEFPCSGLPDRPSVGSVAAGSTAGTGLSGC